MAGRSTMKGFAIPFSFLILVVLAALPCTSGSSANKASQVSADEGSLLQVHTNEIITYDSLVKLDQAGAQAEVEAAAQADLAHLEELEDALAKAQDEEEGQLCLGNKKVQWNFTEKSHITGGRQAIERFVAWDLEQGWSSPKRPDVNASDPKEWPPVSVRNANWKLGLQDPLIGVISLPQRTSRRMVFKEAFQSLQLDHEVHWAPALNGFLMPTDTIWLRGPNERDWVTYGDAGKPGAWGCMASHIALLRTFHERCAICDVVIFEDDIVFAPSFRKRWTKFLSALPEDWDILRLGGQALWTPPVETHINEGYFKVEASSNTWGYVVRARAVKDLIDNLETIPAGGTWGIDAILQLFANKGSQFNSDASFSGPRFNFYAPLVPLIAEVSSCHDTTPSTSKENCDTVEFLRKQARNKKSEWPLGWTRTYCADQAKLQDASFERGSCAQDKDVFGCCPYRGYQNRAPVGPLI